MEKYLCSWSGGKDCCLSLYDFTRKHKPHEITLLTTIDRTSQLSFGHNISKENLKFQADLMNFQIIFLETTFREYAHDWIGLLANLKMEGYSHIIFGDIDLQEHYDWHQKNGELLGLTNIFPLWKQDRLKIIDAIKAANIKPVIISIHKKLCPADYLGKTLDVDTIGDMHRNGIDPTAEGGEFHSIIINSPFHSKPSYVNHPVIKEHEIYRYLDFELTS